MGRIAGPGSLQHIADCFTLDRPRIPVGILHGQVGGAVQLRFSEPQVAQSHIRIYRTPQLEKTQRRGLGAECMRNLLHCSRFGPGVIASSMRQHRGMGCGMRQVE